MVESYSVDTARIILAVIDKGIYGLISTFYNVMMNLSRISILNIEQIENFASKIYALLAVFMVFKVTFSLINYLVNPDKMFDSTKGVQKILVNIILVLAMIILTPTAFTTLYDVQNAILDDDIIPRFFSNETVGTDEVLISPLCGYREDGRRFTVEIPNDGDRFAVIIFRSFYQPEWSRDIDGVSYTYDDFMKKSKEDQTSISHKWKTEDNSDANAYCLSPSVNKLLRASILNSAPKNWDDMYIIDYQILLSSIVGGIVLFLIIGFCFDIAVRSIRLSFLQLIAPIPIISFIDPDSGKNGMFKKWVKDVGKTWASLFIRLVAIYFALYLIEMVASNIGDYKDIHGNPLDLGIFQSFWVNVFMIIGILMFAKKLPSLIEGILGIKLDGKFEMNPLKRVANEALGGKLISGTTTGVLSKTGSFGRNLLANRGKGFKENIKKSWNDSKGSFMAGAKAPGTLAGYKEGTKKLKEDIKNRNAAENNLKQYDEMEKSGKKLLEKSFVYDENGNKVKKKKKIIDENGIEREIETDEYKTDDSKIFSNQQYINSFKNVEATKRAKIKAENAYDAQDKLYAAALQNYGIGSVEAEKARLERENAKKELGAATGKFDLAVKQHEEYKKIYNDDAEKEEILSYYKKTHAAELYDSEKNSSQSYSNNDKGNHENSSSNNDDSKHYSSEEDEATRMYQEAQQGVSGKESSTDSGKRNMEEAIQNTKDDLENGVEDIFIPGVDYVTETTINGVPITEYEEKMKGGKSIVGKTAGKIVEAGASVREKLNDRIYKDNNSEETYHQIPADKYLEGVIDEDGHSTMTSQDMFDEYYKNQELRKQQEKEQEKQEKKGFFNRRNDE